ncbi:MAG: hypothetical protein IMZ46_10350, partial [Acidobacteria bacterium]|nr:hypothetical protein [Acidobacteriota bacterium]
QAQSADKGTLVLAPGILFNPIEPAEVLWTTRGCDTSAGGFWVGHQAAEPSNGPATSHIRRSLEKLHGQAITIAGRKVTPDLQGYRGRRGRRQSGNRAVWGLVLGAVGGFVAGGVIGAEVSAHSCHCANPELHGFIVGAPIGAVVGGFLGFALAGR